MQPNSEIITRSIKTFVNFNLNRCEWHLNFFHYTPSVLLKLVAENWSLGLLVMTPLVSQTAFISFAFAHDGIQMCHWAVCSINKSGLEKTPQCVPPRQCGFRDGKWEKKLMPSTAGTGWWKCTTGEQSGGRCRERGKGHGQRGNAKATEKLSTLQRHF